MKATGNLNRSHSGKKSGNLKKLGLAAAIFCLLQPVAYAQTASGSVVVQSFDIPAQSLAGALREFAKQSQQELLFSPEVVAGKTTNGVKGAIPPSDALRMLLADSGISSTTTPNGALLLRMNSQDEQALEDVTANSNKAKSDSTSQAKVKGTLQATTMDTMVVTGTRIRGGTTASPLIVIGSENIREEGFTDLGEVIRSIPQNFAGGQNPGVNTAEGIQNQNVTGGSALNLRGLGPDATLTLLNGRRLSYGGFVQAVDISAIPVEAVERIEIIPDGASAIYGSDAVGGVANVILKRDFDGVTLGTRYAGATEGGLETREYNATAGATWSTGGLIAIYKESSSDPIFADQRDYTESMFDPKTIYPSSDLRSGLFSIHQSLGHMVELRLDALKTHREQEMYSGNSTYYTHVLSETSISLVSPSLELSLPGDWSLSVGGTYGKDESIYNNYLGYVTTTESIFGSTCYCNESRSYELGAEGPLFELGGGDARLAVGIGSRTDDFLSYSYLSATGKGGEEGAQYAYAELNLPFISPVSNITGIRRLEFSAAVRGEDYDSFGQVTTPKVGLVYDPSADFTLKASWGRSFKAPTLAQRYLNKISYLLSANEYGGSGYASDATVLMSYGGNGDLNPERARTWTTSLSFHPDALPGLEAELTYFDIDYTDRIVQPIGDISQSLSNPNYSEFVSYSPTAEEQATLLAAYDQFYNYAGAAYDPSKVVAIVSDQYTNVARQRVKGLDLSGSYRFDIGEGRLLARGSVSWLKSSQQNSAGQDAYDLAGNVSHPAKIKGRIGAVWAQGGFSASSFVNYIAGVTTSAASKKKTASFTTVDATLRYDTGERDDALSGLEFALSADNLFNRNPPLYSVPYVSFVPYDSTNYSAIGRFLSLSVSKHW